MGTELVPVIDQCVEAGSSHRDCIDLARDGDFALYSVEQLLLIYEVGADRLRRGEIWLAELDWCRFDKGEEACNAAMHDEIVYIFTLSDD